ncbi:MAG TPA: DUF4087 domain-containing protein [Rhodocyclaceae bacterium]|nr:DUF4087 domain-containing protein [Rhodocyclaceae bacterium]
MSTLLIGNIAVAVAEAGPEIQTQTLCGWFENPTPGNAWLRDRKAEWVVGIQGAHQAEGEWPEFRDSQWIKTNSSHGYGCACITGVVNPETHEVISITSARAQSLGVCRKDRALKKPAA